MAEEPGQTEDPPVVTTPVPIIGEDGKFSENWRESLPEDIREEKCLQTFGDIQGMSKSLVHALRTVGKDKIVIPQTDEEWSEFHKVGGRPDTAADYNLVRPEDFPEEHYSPELATTAMELFHKIGLSKTQADALFAFNNNTVLARLQTKKDTDAAARVELETALNQEWGNAFQQKKHLGNVAVEKGTAGDEEFRARLTGKFGDDPDFIRFASNLGSKFAEHGDIAVPTGIPTPADMQAKIDEEMTKPSYQTDYAKHGFTKAQHKAQVDKVYRLRQELIASTKTG